MSITRYHETATALAGAATFNGATRDSLTAPAFDAYFQAYALSDVAGTMRLETSPDGTAWHRTTADTAVGANTAVILKALAPARYNRVVYVNGAGAQATFQLHTAYTAA